MKPIILTALLTSVGCLGSHANEVPEKSRLVMLYGNSMLPTVKDGDIFLVDETIPFEALKCGDAILFHDGRRLMMHRVTECRTAGNGERYVLTRGDNNRTSETVTRRQYRGKAWVGAKANG
jgi:signal peptidase I